MIEQHIEFDLPLPWDNQRFSIDRFGALSYLVGPNGSGKSRFAETLRAHLPNARLLGTDRLDRMSGHAMGNFFGDHFSDGYQKRHFNHIRNAGNAGSGIDAFLILEERPDIRVIIEATLSSLFNRDIILEWDSGNLVPMARMAITGTSYRLDREECHGIRELLVLLTHLHNNENAYLIIDEPELNLHPQYQSFFMQEARKVAGQHVAGTSRKGIFLITHSPFILDLRTVEDMQSVFSFSTDHRPPMSMGDLEAAQRDKFQSLIPRLNVHHKQLFFSDNPIFVEGVSDAQIIEAIQERRNSSITAAGSCLIDVGGCEELAKYVDLCGRYEKKAYFLFDLDSLFTGSLRRCVHDDGEISEFLASLGVGRDFSGYCGQLDRALTPAVRAIEDLDNAEGIVAELQQFFGSLSEGPEKLKRQRIAVLTEISRNRETLIGVLGQERVSDIEGRLNQIRRVLREKNIFLLTGGALEHYLPSYNGHRYHLTENEKKAAVAAEVGLLASGEFDGELDGRYGELYECIATLPAKEPVDVEKVLYNYASQYIHELQNLVVTKPDWGAENIAAHFDASQSRIGKLIELVSFDRTGEREFRARLRVYGPQTRIVDVTDQTNAGMQGFTFEAEPEPAAAAAQ